MVYGPVSSVTDFVPSSFVDRETAVCADWLNAVIASIGRLEAQLLGAPFLNLMDYEAVSGSGGAAATSAAWVAIKAALPALGNRAIILVPPGNWYSNALTEWGTLKVKIVGSGMEQTTFWQNDAAAGLFSWGDASTPTNGGGMANCTINGNAAVLGANGGYGVKVNGAQDLVFDQVWIKNTRSHGMLVTGGAGGSTLYGGARLIHCNITSCAGHGFFADQYIQQVQIIGGDFAGAGKDISGSVISATQGCIAARNTADVILNGVNIDEPAGYGIWLSNCSSIPIIGGYIHSASRHGIYLTGGTTPGSDQGHGITIQGMTFWKNGLGTDNTYADIYVENQKYTTVGGCTFKTAPSGNKAKYAVQEVEGAAGACDYNSYVGNVVIGDGSLSPAYGTGKKLLIGANNVTAGNQW